VSELQRKWEAIYRETTHSSVASEVLSAHRFLLPKQGRALDLACGMGGNALLLAEHGLEVEAWDISQEALTKLRSQASEQRLPITARQCQINSETLEHASFDVIVISRFLDRTLGNAIIEALKPEGLLFYQTFTRNKLDQQGPTNRDYLLNCNELLRLFSPLTLVFYQEYARIGDLLTGNRNEACFIGQKPTGNQIDD
jgi:tellurite methyltransferase